MHSREDVDRRKRLREERDCARRVSSIVGGRRYELQTGRYAALRGDRPRVVKWRDSGEPGGKGFKGRSNIRSAEGKRAG